MNKSSPLLLRKFISMAFTHTHTHKWYYTLPKIHVLPPVFMPVKGSFQFSLGFVQDLRFQPSSQHILGNIRGDAKKERRSERADLKEMKVVYFLKTCFVVMALNHCETVIVGPLKHCKSSSWTWNDFGDYLFSSFQRMQLFWRGFV